MEPGLVPMRELIVNLTVALKYLLSQEVRRDGLSAGLQGICSLTRRKGLAEHQAHDPAAYTV
jgi:hypothetical protein